MVVVLTEVGAEGLRETIQELATFFYMYGGLVALTWPERLQRTFNVLIDLFGQVGLCTTVRKMVSMDFWPFYIPNGFLESAYMRRVTGVGPSFQ